MYAFTCTATIDEAFDALVAGNGGANNVYEVVTPTLDDVPLRVTVGGRADTRIPLFLDVENFPPASKAPVMVAVEEALVEAWNATFPPAHGITEAGLVWADASKGAKGSLHAIMRGGAVFPSVKDLKAFVHGPFTHHTTRNAASPS